VPVLNPWKIGKGVKSFLQLAFDHLNLDAYIKLLDLGTDSSLH
jgi:hypothetical protein